MKFLLPVHCVIEKIEAKIDTKQQKIEAVIERIGDEGGKFKFSRFQTCLKGKREKFRKIKTKINERKSFSTFRDLSQLAKLGQN